MTADPAPHRLAARDTRCGTSHWVLDAEVLNGGFNQFFSTSLSGWYQSPPPR